MAGVVGRGGSEGQKGVREKGRVGHKIISERSKCQKGVWGMRAGQKIIGIARVIRSEGGFGERGQVRRSEG